MPIPEEGRKVHYALRKKPGMLDILANNHHFLTVIHAGGIFDIRPHPGLDPNGWGTSLYIQPFFPGALLRKAKVLATSLIDNGVIVKAGGTICRANDISEGEWSIEFAISYDPQKRIARGDGRYEVSLARPLTDIEGGDLNLLKIASNYLRNIPHYDGSIGDTGDFSMVGFRFDNRMEPWDLRNPLLTTFFQPELRGEKELACLLTGELYDNNSKAQGFDRTPIARAYKPSIKLSLMPKAIYPLTFFALYADGIDPIATKKYGRDIHFSETYWHDNVGITPIILARDCLLKNFSFDIAFASESIEPKK